MSYYMGVDIGTSSVKSMLISGDGNVAGTEQVGYNIIKERLSWAEQDMEELWQAARQTIAALVKRFPGEAAQISCISYSG